MARQRLTTLAVPFLIAGALHGGATTTSAQEGTLRLESAEPGREVVVRIHVTPATRGGAAPVQVVGGTRAGREGEYLRVRTPVDIRIDPTQRFRATFASAVPQQVLHLVLTPTDAQPLVIDGTEFLLERPRTGAPVELEARGTSVRVAPRARR